MGIQNSEINDLVGVGRWWSTGRYMMGRGIMEMWVWT